jgi:OmpA-OmpF porin, OOP family
MRKTILLALTAMLTMAAFAVQAADDTGDIFFSPMAQFTHLDRKRLSDDGFGFQVGLGKNFTPNWSVEAQWGRGEFNAGGRYLTTINEYGLDALYRFLPDSAIRPYLVMGAGGLHDKQDPFDASSAFIAEGGAGVLFALGDQTAPTRWGLRAEAKYRHSFTGTNYGAYDPNDLLISAGFIFSFGNHAPKPVAAPPPPLDSDGDGVPDDRDRCPGTPAGAKVDVNGCELDSDGDGVVDRLDQCPDTPKGTPVNAVGCPLDSDGDGVIDSMDQCPNTPKGDRVDVHGCTIKDEIKLPRVNFMTDSAVLLPESREVLDDAVAALKKYPELVVEVRGHTDSRGSAKHNVLLSQRRAESVEAYLKEHGVTNTLTAKGYGEKLPIADNKTEEGRLENRRVSLKIIGGQ